MLLKGVIFEDFVNYKKPCMTLEFPYCTFKCGGSYCQNSPLAQKPNIDVDITSLISRYLCNPITSAVCFQGLEPFDSEQDMMHFIASFRALSDDDIVIYTGYTENEICKQLKELKQYKNIIIKFGRYKPNSKSRYDDLLGITLASDNQYAVRVEDIDMNKFWWSID